MRSEVIAFPARGRLGDIKRCARILEDLHGPQADSFWREECRALAAGLLALGYDEAAMRCEVADFQAAVQAELLAASMIPPKDRRQPAASAPEAANIDTKYC